MIKAKIVKDGATIEIECESAAEFATVMGSTLTSSTPKARIGRPLGSKTGSGMKGNSVKRIQGKTSGSLWSPRDIGIVAKIIKTSLDKNKNWGISNRARQQLSLKGDVQSRTRGSVSMLMMQIKRHLSGRTQDVPSRIAEMLNEAGYQFGSEKDAIGKYSKRAPRTQETQQTQGTVAARPELMDPVEA